nr:hypothetical protein BaRGS_025845 [Batillaria attramentaria]
MASKSKTIEPPSVEEYDRISGDVTTYGSLALVLALAKDTGMVRVLCEADTPLTSSDIAKKAGLKERYVRETLDALVAGRLLQLAPGTGGEGQDEARYVLNEPHRDTFKRTANLAMTVYWCASLFKSIKEILPVDGPYTMTTHEHEQEQEESEDDGYSMLDELNSMAMDATVEALLSTPGLRQRLESGIEVGEIGSGSGQLALRLAAMFPRSRFTLTDLLQGPLDRAKKAAEAQGLTNVSFDVLDAMKPPDSWKERFDWMLAARVIIHVPDPQVALNNVSKALRPGGHLSLLESFKSMHVANNMGSGEAVSIYTENLFLFLPDTYQKPGDEGTGQDLGEERARKLATQAGLRVLGFAKYKGIGAGSAVCMCQKEAGGQK